MDKERKNSNRNTISEKPGSGKNGGATAGRIPWSRKKEEDDEDEESDGEPASLVESEEIFEGGGGAVHPSPQTPYDRERFLEEESEVADPEETEDLDLVPEEEPVGEANEEDAFQEQEPATPEESSQTPPHALEGSQLSLEHETVSVFIPSSLSPQQQPDLHLDHPSPPPPHSPPPYRPSGSGGKHSIISRRYSLLNETILEEDEEVDTTSSLESSAAKSLTKSIADNQNDISPSTSVITSPSTPPSNYSTPPQETQEQPLGNDPSKESPYLTFQRSSDKRPSSSPASYSTHTQTDHLPQRQDSSRSPPPQLRRPSSSPATYPASASQEPAFQEPNAQIYSFRYPSTDDSSDSDEEDEKAEQFLGIRNVQQLPHLQFERMLRLTPGPLMKTQTSSVNDDNTYETTSDSKSSTRLTPPHHHPPRTPSQQNQEVHHHHHHHYYFPPPNYPCPPPPPP